MDATKDEPVSPPRIKRISKMPSDLNPYAREYKPRSSKQGLNPYAPRFDRAETEAATILLGFRAQGERK